MADPRKISRLRCGLAQGSVWLAIITSICYVTLFEPNYSAHTVCDRATQTRVVVDPLLSGVKKPILIGSNAGYLFVISADKCNTRDETSDPQESEDGDWMSIVSDLFDRAWGYVSDRWNYLWSNDETAPPQQAVVVPLSRVLCMYEVNARGRQDAGSVQCQAGAPPVVVVVDGPPAELEDRVRQEIRDKLKTENLSCGDDWKISEPIVFRPGEFEESVVTTDDETVAGFIESLELQDGRKATMHVFGLASADGDHRYNQQLSKKRADTVREQIKAANQQIDVGKSFSLGEDHLASGVAESRSVRVVACVSSD